MKTEWVIVAVAAVGVCAYLLALYVLPAMQGPERTYDVDGLKVISAQQPKEALTALLAGEVRLEMDLEEGASDGNQAVSAVGSELVYVFANMSRPLGVYQVLSGKPDAYFDTVTSVSTDCANTTLCSNATIIVRAGACNCMRIGKQVVIEGDRQFAKDRIAQMRGIIRMVLSELGPSEAASPLKSLVQGNSS